MRCNTAEVRNVVCRNYEYREGMYCTLGHNTGGVMSKSPCFPKNAHIKCPARNWLTQEEMDAEIGSTSRITSGILTARAIIMLSGMPDGVIECPECGHKMHFSIGSNGHCSASCVTIGCLRWIE